MLEATQYVCHLVTFGNLSYATVHISLKIYIKYLDVEDRHSLYLDRAHSTCVLQQSPDQLCPPPVLRARRVSTVPRGNFYAFLRKPQNLQCVASVTSTGCESNSANWHDKPNLLSRNVLRCAMLTFQTCILRNPFLSHGKRVSISYQRYCRFH